MTGVAPVTRPSITKSTTARTVLMRPVRKVSHPLCCLLCWWWWWWWRGGGSRGGGGSVDGGACAMTGV